MAVNEQNDDRNAFEKIVILKGQGKAALVAFNLIAINEQIGKSSVKKHKSGKA